jgi:hypothetical protein
MYRTGTLPDVMVFAKTRENAGRIAVAPKGMDAPPV